MANTFQSHGAPPGAVGTTALPRPLRWLELTLPSAAENLACDEALLDECEAAPEAPPILRCWESPDIFVVLGHGNAIRGEVNLPACERLGVPVLRRCSGGGTVVQGPGCLNYALLLPIAAGGPLVSVVSANRWIMERQRQALATLTAEPVAVKGHTDLVLADRKFSGNAQRRARHWLLFHGTILLQFDLGLIERLLAPLPPRRPTYRHDRAHRDFVTSFPASPDSVKVALRAAWSATEVCENWPRTRVARLAAEKYSRAEWTWKF